MTLWNQFYNQIGITCWITQIINSFLFARNILGAPNTWLKEIQQNSHSQEHLIDYLPSQYQLLEITGRFRPWQSILNLVLQVFQLCAHYHKSVHSAAGYSLFLLPLLLLCRLTFSNLLATSIILLSTCSPIKVPGSCNNLYTWGHPAGIKCTWHTIISVLPCWKWFCAKLIVVLSINIYFK